MQLFLRHFFQQKRWLGKLGPSCKLNGSPHAAAQSGTSRSSGDGWRRAGGRRDAGLGPAVEMSICETVAGE